MNDIKYTLAIIMVTLFCTYFTPWWLIPLLVAGLSFFYTGGSLKAFGISVSTTSGIWILLAILKDVRAEIKASALVGELFGQLSPGYIFALTGLIIGLVSGLAASCGQRSRQYFKVE